jgi:hypothetical protein
MCMCRIAANIRSNSEFVTGLVLLGVCGRRCNTRTSAGIYFAEWVVLRTGVRFSSKEAESPS